MTGGTGVLPFAPPRAAAADAEPLFDRAMFAIDFGPASLAAARWATAHVARRAHAIVAHVAPAEVPVPASLAGGLGGFAATLDVASARTVLRVGRPSHWLSAVARDAEASLVVTGRRRDANRTRIGEPNVIERLARRADASVLVVPEGTDAAPRHMIAAVDESRFAPAVLRVARWLARRHACTLTVLHVLPPAAGAYDRVIRSPFGRSGRRAAIGPLSVERSRSFTSPMRIGRWLAALARPARAARDAATMDRIEIVAGDPAREIATIAAECDAPLIVVGQRGADEAPPGSLGSVARELLTRAPVPVLCVGGA